MGIRLLKLVAKLFPKSWRARAKVRLRELAGETPINPNSPRTPETITPHQPQVKEASTSLLEFYYQHLTRLDPDSPDFLTFLDELKGIRELLKKRYPVEQLTARRTFQEAPAVSIIIPVYKNHFDLEALLCHLDTKTSFRSFEVIIVNNCPDAPIPANILNRDYRFSITFLTNHWNAGRTVSNNTGARYAKGDFLLFLNSDISPKRSDWLEKMLSTMKADSMVGVVGAKTLFLASNRIEHFGMYPIYVPQFDCWNNAHYFQGIDDGVFPETLLDQDTDMVTGAAMMVRAELFQELDGFNESFVIGGFEDSDFCRRARQAGYEIRVSAGAVLEHRKSASLRESSHYSGRIADCNIRYYNHLWAKTLHQRQADDEIHHPFKRKDRKLRVLFVAHGYPPEQVGGTEVYNKHLAEAVNELPGFESVVLARGRLRGPESLDGEVVLDHEVSNAFSVFRCLRSDMEFINAHAGAELGFEMLLSSISPDIIHFNHTENLSTNFVKIARRCIRGPILYTLNEFLPICANLGLMVMSDGRLCTGAEVAKCASCVKVDPSLIERRWNLYRDNFSDVTLFIAPSKQLKEKFARWGLNSDAIRHKRYGMKPLPLTTRKTPNSVIEFLYIGQILPYKGVAVLLDAAGIIAKRANGRFQVHIYGNMHPMWEPFNSEVLRKIKRQRDFVTFHGEYANDELPRILAESDVVVVPSTWWENSPLTIQEAFLAGVPVITSNIGGMKELVHDGVHGLLFEVKNSKDLAQKMLSIIEDPQQLSVFRENLRNQSIQSIDEHAHELAEVYQELLSASEQLASP